MSEHPPVTGNTSRTQPENRAFFPALDGLRAIAFLMVFLVHYFGFPWGWAGVNIFFVLSGFLITGILVDTQDDPHRARNFYVRRTLRIFPLYYGIFAVIALLYPIFHWRWSFAWIAWPLYAGNFLRFTSPATAQPGTPENLTADAHLESIRSPQISLSLGHFWTLCVEEQFYLAWPWIVFWVRSRRVLGWICVAAVILVPTARVITSHIAPQWMLSQELLNRATPFQLDALLLGGLLALLWRSSFRNRLLKVGQGIAVCASVATAIYLCRTLHISDPNWMHDYTYPTWRLTWGASFINFFGAGLILCALRPFGFLFRVLCLRPLRWLGRLSYGAYVFHDIPHPIYDRIIFFLFRNHRAFLHAHAEAAAAVLGFAGTLLLAWLSFRYFESWFLDLKERWTVRSA